MVAKSKIMKEALQVMLSLDKVLNKQNISCCLYDEVTGDTNELYHRTHKLREDLAEAYSKAVAVKIKEELLEFKYHK